MKRSEKRGIIISVILILAGIIGLIYAKILNNHNENVEMMYSYGITYLILGIGIMYYFIKLSKDKEKSNKQEIIYNDERINSIRYKSFAITFKIVLGLSLLFDFLATFFLKQYQEIAYILNKFVVCSGFIYLTVYKFISRKN